MKDEELAEEFYYKTYPVTLSIGEEERKKKVMNIFLAGLKAGRPQWHDLRKDPNDLPYMETELLCQKSSGRCFVGYYSCDNKFHSHETGRSYDIIRWMDIGIWWNVSKA